MWYDTIWQQYEIIMISNINPGTSWSISLSWLQRHASGSRWRNVTWLWLQSRHPIGWFIAWGASWHGLNDKLCTLTDPDGGLKMPGSDGDTTSGDRFISQILIKFLDHKRTSLTKSRSFNSFLSISNILLQKLLIYNFPGFLSTCKHIKLLWEISQIGMIGHMWIYHKGTQVVI